MEHYQKKVIVFDMDGVLFDTIPFARQAFLKTHPGVTKEKYAEIHTGNYYEEAAKYFHLKVAESEEQKEKRIKEYSKGKSKAALFEGVWDLLSELHREGYTLVLNTNAFARNTLPLLENAGINGLFDFIGSAEISKTKDEKFRVIANRYHLDTNALLFITDTLGDVREADIAGVPTIAVTWGVHVAAYFAREEHVNLIAIVNTVAELRQAIRQAP